MLTQMRQSMRIPLKIRDAPASEPSTAMIDRT
jgi:hypothetical protein